MASRRGAVVGAIAGVAVFVLVIAGREVRAQESGALPTSSRSAWSRMIGSRQYEYDERVDLSLDGSAIVDINASIAALVALRGAELNLDPEARFDRQAARALFEGPNVAVTELSTFRKHGRRFVHARLRVADICSVSQVRALSWSRYRLDRSDSEYHYVQDVGPPTGSAPREVGWTGEELVAFRLHLPSKINFHNSPDDVERGNVLAWEQRLQDRVSGAPLHMEVRMQTQSILYRTLYLFAGTFLAAVIALAAVVWWIMRKGRSLSQHRFTSSARPE
jgi:hypothetical protein